jgi:hypothetical protein
MSDGRSKTIFCDIDGVLLCHSGDITKQHLEKGSKLIISSTLDKLREWDKKGYNIILVTGRRESVREHTEKQLAEVGIFYDKLVMGIGGGVRILINDKKNNSYEDTAIAINLIRNEGIGKCTI